MLFPIRDDATRVRAGMHFAHYDDLQTPCSEDFHRVIGREQLVRQIRSCRFIGAMTWRECLRDSSMTCEAQAPHALSH
eukprot:3701188-Amphidinium_carterae.1